MRKLVNQRRMTVALVMAVAAGVGLSAPASANPGTPVELVVGLAPGTSAEDALAAADDAGGARVVDDAAREAGAVVAEVSARDADEAVALLRRDPGVAFVDRNHVAAKADVTPDDPFYPEQWGLRKVNVPGAWSMTTGDPVTVAVLDTGVNEVSDLAGRVLPGYDFINDDANPADDEGHGTAVASVIGGRGDDGTGMAGVCWDCRILPVKVLDSEGSGDYLSIAKGIRYAADHGAKVINMSLAGAASSPLLNTAVQYATEKGSLVIAAAGNEDTAVRQYPAAIPQVLSVGGSTSGDGRYSWSNYGTSWVDIAAPGCNVAQDYRSRGYVDFCGTSSATPLVAGVAALMQSRAPSVSGAYLGTVLSLSSSKLGWVRHGRINAGRAVWAVTDAAAPAVSLGAPAAGTLLHGTATVTAAATDNTGLDRVELVVNDTVVGVDRAAPYSFRWNSAAHHGIVNVAVRAVDWTGRVTTAARRFEADNRGPALTVTAPKSGSTVKKTVTVKVSASDKRGVARVELLVNGKVTGTGTSFKISTGRYGKKFTVRVRAYDKLGNVSWSPTYTYKR
ncbi:subtilisin family serine protease [Catenuloplanes nepalensis]|uniref:Subtilisin family serine protease n=1 Tax=Catenuloplanes nepalensis TaxID=587533 RepID=A0ABT9N7K5_9ACTN|nr:S8 family serine peptidase [Catenuloplanes nepalensis]MDP9799236.1 subtilisin family serine protease [Catenuloplanes nepalensis]